MSAKPQRYVFTVYDAEDKVIERREWVKPFSVHIQNLADPIRTLIEISDKPED